ncbi:MAG: hypothetical protein P4L34_09715 [Paludibacter sp.]|nr:hypothetical protein [Paludibacter sp.]
MKAADSYVTRNLFNEEVFDLILEYLDNNVTFTEEGVAVNPKTKEIKLISPKELGSNWEFYPIAQFIRKNEAGTALEPDVDATLDLADKYFFLR